MKALCANEFLDVPNPAAAETMVRMPLSPLDEVDEAVHAAQTAFPAKRGRPSGLEHSVPLQAQEVAVRTDRCPHRQFASAKSSSRGKQ
jgi:hypothetical protein